MKYYFLVTNQKRRFLTKKYKNVEHLPPPHLTQLTVITVIKIVSVSKTGWKIPLIVWLNLVNFV